jgi:hypothetical protein
MEQLFYHDYYDKNKIAVYGTRKEDIGVLEVKYNGLLQTFDSTRQLKCGQESN